MMLETAAITHALQGDEKWAKQLAYYLSFTLKMTYEQGLRHLQTHQPSLTRDQYEEIMQLADYAN